MIWHKISDKLPDHTTRYAGEYGVPILAFDEEDFVYSGGNRPSETVFSFEHNCFKELSGKNGFMQWIEAPWFTHWCELPELPSESIERRGKAQNGN